MHLSEMLLNAKIKHSVDSIYNNSSGSTKLLGHLAVESFLISHQAAYGTKVYRVLKSLEMIDLRHVSGGCKVWIY